MGETLGRNGDGLDWRRRLLGNFGFLAGWTTTALVPVVIGEASPHVTGGDEAARGADSRMSQGMNTIKYLPPQGGRYQRPLHTARDIT
jgi:hypothetical protein